MFREIFVFIGLVAAVLASPPMDRGGRIMGGSAASITRFPFVAAIGSRSEFWCTASIVNNRWVLTAAHCTEDLGNTGYRIRVGSQNINSGGVVLTSSRVINHPQYNPRSLFNDISVVQTASTIVFNSNTQPCALASAFTGGGVSVISVGFGSLTPTGPMSNTMQQLATQTLTNADCRNRWGSSDGQYIVDHKICSLIRRGAGICYGDSGGPLVQGQNTVIGVVSWSYSCGSGWPDVHIRVSSFRNWIINNT